MAIGVVALVSAALAVALVSLAVVLSPVQAAGPQDDVAKLNQVAIKALDAAKAGRVDAGLPFRIAPADGGPPLVFETIEPIAGWTSFRFLF